MALKRISDYAAATLPLAGTELLELDASGSPRKVTVADLSGAANTLSVQTVASSATVTPLSTNDLVKVTAQAANLTLANPSGTAQEGWGMVIRVKDNGTSRTISYGTEYRAFDGVTLPTATVIGKTHYLVMVRNDTDTKWDVSFVGTV